MKDILQSYHIIIMIYLIKTKVLQLYGKYKDTKSYNVNEKISFDLIQGFVFEGNTYRGTIVEIDERDKYIQNRSTIKGAILTNK